MTAVARNTGRSRAVAGQGQANNGSFKTDGFPLMHDAMHNCTETTRENNLRFAHKGQDKTHNATKGHLAAERLHRKGQV